MKFLLRIGAHITRNSRKAHIHTMTTKSHFGFVISQLFYILLPLFLCYISSFSISIKEDICVQRFGRVAVRHHTALISHKYCLLTCERIWYQNTVTGNTSVCMCVCVLVFCTNIQIIIYEMYVVLHTRILGSTFFFFFLFFLVVVVVVVAFVSLIFAGVVVVAAIVYCVMCRDRTQYDCLGPNSMLICYREIHRNRAQIVSMDFYGLTFRKLAYVRNDSMLVDDGARQWYTRMCMTAMWVRCCIDCYM